MYCHAVGVTTVLTVLTIVTSMATFIRQKIVFNFQNSKNKEQIKKKNQANSKEDRWKNLSGGYTFKQLY